jgi:hypothetical protein
MIELGDELICDFTSIKAEALSLSDRLQPEWKKCLHQQQIILWYASLSLSFLCASTILGFHSD